MSYQREHWTPSIWQEYPTKHQPQFSDRKQLSAILALIKRLPPLVHAADIEELKKQLRTAAENGATILQGGDCAETFADCNGERLYRQLKLITQMGVVTSCTLDKPTIKIGRIAGQYAKPRSYETELIDGKEVLTFRGESINGFDTNDRQPNPERLLRAYFHAATTINYLSAVSKHETQELIQWTQQEESLLGHPALNSSRALQKLNLEFQSRFLKDTSSKDFFTSHEALYLAYEEQFTKYVDKYDAWYNLSAHMLWIGERTSNISGGHVAYASGIANPIGLKIGPTFNGTEIIAIINRLNPLNDPGKVLLITRMGKNNVGKLRNLITAVNETSRKVIWLCDPMHGNTSVGPGGHKIRFMDDMNAELEATSRLHAERGSTLNGLHLEFAGESVTECVGGSRPVHLENITDNYLSQCDPRLNYSQALDMAMLFGQLQCQIQGKDL